jgi:uncharacterized membrane protein
LSNPVECGEAFRWSRDTGIVGLGVLPGVGGHSEAFGVSSDGNVIVGTSTVRNNTPGTIDDFNAVYWTSAGIQSHLALPYAVATGVSADGGTIVGSAFFLSANWPYRSILPSGPERLEYHGTIPDDPIIRFASAADVSADGTVIVGTANINLNAYVPFRWTQDTGMVLIDWMSLPIGSDEQHLTTAVSADGSVIVGYLDDELPMDSSRTTAFRWSQETGFVRLGHLQAAGNEFRSQANAVSIDGGIVVGASYAPSTGSVAMVWTQGNGLQSLQDVLERDFGLEDELSGWTLTRATASGSQEAWVASLPIPIPEPHAGFIVIVTVVILATTATQSWRLERGFVLWPRT